VADTETDRAAERAASEAVAERLGAAVYDLTVVDARMLTSSIRQIRLTAPGLAGLGSLPGQDLMLSVPTEPSGTDPRRIRRRYSIRRVHVTDESVDLNVVLHGDGPGARWAATVEPGHVIEGIGPRGKVFVNPDAAWHLFVGDEAFLPAAFAMAESLRAATPALVVVEVDSAAEHLPLAAAACPEGPTWVHRSTGNTLSGALAELGLPSAGAGHAYLGGEFHAVAALRDQLAERGLAPEQISPKAYWRSDSANAGNGEPPKE
jgi:NADPH-dependent ferric siderophore reductase